MHLCDGVGTCGWSQCAGEAVNSETYENYLRDLVYWFKECSEEARIAKTNDFTAFQDGREMAYTEVLLKMQSLADAFDIPLANLGLDNFDPLASKGVARDG